MRFSYRRKGHYLPGDRSTQHSKAKRSRVLLKYKPPSLQTPFYINYGAIWYLLAEHLYTCISTRGHRSLKTGRKKYTEFESDTTVTPISVFQNIEAIHFAQMHRQGILLRPPV